MGELSKMMDFIGFILNNPETGKKRIKKSLTEQELEQKSRETSEQLQKSLEALRKNKK